MERGIALWAKAMEFRVVWEIDIDATSRRSGLSEPDSTQP